MGRKKSRRSRSVYDPNIDHLSFSQTSEELQAMDPLALEAQQAYSPAVQIIEEEIFDPRNARGIPRMSDAQKRRYYVLVPLLLALMVTLAILGAKAGAGNGSTVTLTTGDPSYILPEPASKIFQVCTSERVNNESGRVACEKLCEVAECCSFDASLETSCKTSNAGTCQMYTEPCKVLDAAPIDFGGGSPSLPTPAPVTTTDAVPTPASSSSTTKTAVSASQSSSTTKVVATSSQSSSTTKTATTSSSQPPLLTAAPPSSSSTTEMAPSSPSNIPVNETLQKQLEEICAADYEDCLDACAVALCCFPPQSLNGGCTGKEINCETYRACESL